VKVPPTTSRFRRDLDQHIFTQQLPAERGGWVVATYTDARAYVTPQDAPVFARMVWQPQLGAAPARWTGYILLQTFELGEGAALRALLATLEMTGLYHQWTSHDWAVLHSIAHDLSHPVLSTPWDQQPFPRGPKPRRRRLRWRDENGRRVNVYPDTLQRYAHLPPRTAEDDIEEDPNGIATDADQSERTHDIAD